MLTVLFADHNHWCLDQKKKYDYDIITHYTLDVPCAQRDDGLIINDFQLHVQGTICELSKSY